MDYQQLQADIANELNRSDLAGDIPSFIRRAENSLRRDIRLQDYPPITRLSDDEPTNWLLEDWDDIYFYAALVESAPFLKEDERIPVWRTELDRRLEEMHLKKWNQAWRYEIPTRPRRVYGGRYAGSRDSDPALHPGRDSRADWRCVGWCSDGAQRHS